MVIFLGIFTIFIVVGFIVIVLFAVALVRASKKSRHEPDVYDQVRNAISVARRIKYRADSDIRKIRLWANQAIAEAFGDNVASVPTDELLENYQRIRNENADKIDAIVLEKLDSLVASYNAQIELKKTERETAEKIEQKYSALLEQLREANQKQRLISKLDKQSQRMEQMQNNISTKKKLIEQSYSYDIIAEDVKQKLATMKALEELQQKYSSPELIQDTTLYRDELQQITREMDI